MHQLALGGLIGPAIFVFAVVLSSSLREDYSHLAQFISELGASGSSRSGVMNYLGFIPGGLGLVGFGISFWFSVPGRGPTRAAAGLISCFGAGVVASGLISCDVGCPSVGGSAENFVHDKIGPIAFLCAIAAAGLSGVSFRRDPAWNDLSTYSFGSSLLGLGLLAMLASSLEQRELTGLWQRLLLADLFAWCGVVGWRIFQTDAESPHAV